MTSETRRRRLVSVCLALAVLVPSAAEQLAAAKALLGRANQPAVELQTWLVCRKVIARLKPGVSLAHSQAQMDQIAAADPVVALRTE